MTIVRLKERSCLAFIAAQVLKVKQMALVVNKTIYLHNTDAKTFTANNKWLLHELKHVEQYEQYGTFGFIFRYIQENFRKGYSANRFEEEARNAVSEKRLATKYRVVHK